MNGEILTPGGILGVEAQRARSKMEIVGHSLVAQQVKDPVLSLLWLSLVTPVAQVQFLAQELLLSQEPQAQPKKKKE